MFTRLLVALDRTRLAEGCIGIAVAIARASDADLDLVCVTEPQPFPALRATSDAVKAIQGEEYLRNVADQVVGAGIERVFHSALVGDAVSELCAHARSTGADFLVVASHGRNGLDRVWWRSMAHELVRKSGIPVLVLREAALRRAPLTGFPVVRRVLVTLDGSELAKTVLNAAVALASSLGAELHLLQVVQPSESVIASWRSAVDAPDLGLQISDPAALMDADETARRMQAASASLSESMRAVERFHAAPVFMHLVQGTDVASAIVEFSSAHDIDIVALASRGRGLTRLLVGSVADRILRTCDLPVLTLYAKSPDFTESESGKHQTLRQSPAYIA